MTNKILLSFDVEEFDLPEEYNFGTVPENDKYNVSGNGMKTVMDVIEAEKVPVTFFVTANFATHFPELLQRMVKSGGEIASHGVSHSSFSVPDLAKSKEILQKLSGQDIIGFRMARLAPVKKQEILNAGYLYESSLNPVWLPGRYNHFRAPLLPFQENNELWQYPVSAVPGVRFPLFWLSFKTLPESLYHLFTKFTVARTHYFNLYTHPWEYNAEARNPQWKIPGYITKHAGPELAERLTHLIRLLKTIGEFKTFREDF